MRASSSTLEYYNTSSDTWVTLKTGYTSDDFGFADNNVNTDQISYVYFGNGNEAFSRWNGSITSLTSAISAGGSTLNVVSTSDFPYTGTVHVCGTDNAYSTITATTIVLDAPISVDCASGTGISTSVEEFSGDTYPRGNIYLFADNRLFISGATSSANIVYFSGYGTSTDFGDMATLVSSSTVATAGLFNLAEGGGAVKAMVMDEGSIYIFKRSIIYKATLTDAIYSLETLKAYDSKSQTTGSFSKNSVFTGGNGVFFITPDNQIMYLNRVQQVDYPQIVPISDSIKNTVSGLDFSDMKGIVYRDRAFFACKSSVDATMNDTVLIYNIVEQNWDTPVVGINASDWSIYQDAEVEELYFGDTTVQNVYKIINTPTDYVYDIKASWRSKQYTFGVPYSQKIIENAYVEGYVSQNTTLTISLLLDEDGYTQKYSTTLTGTDSAYIYNSSIYNVFGLSPYGVNRFGSQSDLSGKKKFRVYLGKDFRQIPFYNAQIEFASDGDNQNWEITNYAFLVRQNNMPEKRELYKSFK